MLQINGIRYTQFIKFMITENMKKLEGLIKQEPYEIMKVKTFKTVISLHGFEFAEVPNNVAEDVIALLNGAFKEGVMGTLIQYKINLDELPKVEI